MQKIIQKILFCLLIVFLSNNALAQDKRMIEERDTIMVEIIGVDSNLIEEIQDNPSYVYDRVEDYGFWKTVKSRLANLAERFIEWLMKLFDDKDATMPEFPKRLFYIILISIFVLIVLGVFFLIINHNRKNRKVGVKPNKPFEIEEEKENIVENDYDKLLLEAEAALEYRLCVRYLFNNLLKSLNKKEYIEWALKKTNYDYFTELRSTDFAENYRKLSWIYDNIWYGEKDIELFDYTRIKEIFTKINSKIDES